MVMDLLFRGSLESSYSSFKRVIKPDSKSANEERNNQENNKQHLAKIQNVLVCLIGG